MRAFCILACFLPVVAFATAQFPEELMLDGNKETMMATPLEDYFSAEQPKPKELYAFSSACWRGYIGHWEVRDDALFLVGLTRRVLVRRGGPDGEYIDENEEIPMSLVFTGAKGPIPADWFSGIIRIAQGEELEYVHMGFASVYERDVFLTVVKGRVVGRRTVDNRGQERRSAVNLAWRELGRVTKSGGVRVRTPEEAASEEEGNWMDARVLWPRMPDLVKSGETVVVRAIYFTKRLWLDASLELPIDCDEISELPREGAAAEVTGILAEDASGRIILRVKAARELPPGSAIEKSPPQGEK